ncbi:hypothetical protein L5G28_07705 [Gordonia sp. HY285]|uniref:hypothetical protein n=1 Tax=Gordonia liuliyuniae TaxID=2911517 RepID=UPI001F3B92AC|nr:hypothetical protein [Gordonia liuliyuniae]MCF8610046.1 hypothetical protein [Gordonia liuliyuniae]
MTGDCFFTPTSLGTCPACNSQTVTPEGESILAEFCLWDNDDQCADCRVCGACTCSGPDQTNTHGPATPATSTTQEEGEHHVP